jgi:threonine dehydrogenase-like Zn-dependent dehydrogenase
LTGNYLERGIFGLHGYFAEYAVDSAADLVKVPPALVDYAVLLEPLSVVEKAVETALRIHEPLPSSGLVLGAGTIGILTALVLQLCGLTVSLHSLEPPEHPRVRLIEAAGIRYSTSLSQEKADIVIEATGSAQAAFAALRCLAPLGVCGVIGAAMESQGLLSFRELLVQNQAIFGSVNASPRSFAQAVEDLSRIEPEILRRLVHRVGFSDFHESILGPPVDSPKIAHVIS